MNFLTHKLNPNMLGVILGLISGLAMNIYTGEMVGNPYLWAIIYLFFSMFFVVALMYMYDLFSRQFDLKIKEPGENRKGAWSAAIRDKKHWITCYLLFLIGFLGFLAYGIYTIKQVNSQVQVAQNEKDRVLTGNKLILEQRIMQLTTEIQQQKKTIKQIYEEIKETNKKALLPARKE